MSSGSAMRCSALRRAICVALAGIELVRHLGLDEAGRDRVDGDAERAEFARQRPGEADQRRLGRAVDRQPAVAGAGDDRADIDDAAAARRSSSRARRISSAPSARAVFSRTSRSICGVAHGRQDAARADAGVVDQPVQRAELLVQPLSRSAGIARDIGEVAGAELDRAAAGVGLARRRRQLRAVAPGDRDHLMAGRARARAPSPGPGRGCRR